MGVLVVGALVGLVVSFFVRRDCGDGFVGFSRLEECVEVFGSRLSCRGGGRLGGVVVEGLRC